MKYIYIVFSATPYKMGSFIRHMLNNRYNHVALSFEEDLSEMYSFSRRHANTPFFGGIVHESFGRYEWNGDFSDIKVCRHAVSEKKICFFAQIRSENVRAISELRLQLLFCRGHTR